MSNSGKFNGFHRYIKFCRNLTFSLTKVMQAATLQAWQALQDWHPGLNIRQPKNYISVAAEAKQL